MANYFAADRLATDCSSFDQLLLRLFDFLVLRRLLVAWLRSRCCRQLDSLPATDPVATDAGPPDTAADFESLPVFDLCRDDADA